MKQVSHYKPEDIHHINESIDRFNTEKASDMQLGALMMVGGFFGGGFLYILSLNKGDHMAPVYEVLAFLIGIQFFAGLLKYLGARMRRM